MRVLLLAFFTLYIGNTFSQTISEIQGEADSSPYFEQIVTTSGIVTGITSEGYFIQDGIGEWTGLYVFDSTQSPALGDEINVTGTVDEFFGFTEIQNLTEFVVISANNPLPAATELSTNEIPSEAYESVLVQVNMAECTNPDLGFNEFELNDGSGPCNVDDFIFFYTPSLGVHYEVSGPLYYSYGDFKILPRDINDVVIDEPLYYTIDPEETIIDTNSLTIEWQTNVESETRLLYGTTPSYELGDLEITDLNTEHLIEIADLQAATVYYVAAVSSDGVNMTPVKEWVVCTKSESSGNIEVFFNHSVDTSVATETEAVYDPDFTGLYVEYIQSAIQTLDIAMYDWNEIPTSIIDAINTAHSEGIGVRIVTDNELENLALAQLASAIPVVFGTDEGIMHDKFLIIDVDLTTAKVVGGSTNWTDGNLGWDFNNIVTIEDQSLARAYTLEFNEMFGSSDGTPNPLFSRFGAEKLDNTPHKFEIGEIPVELYFSPSDGATAQMVEHINAAESRIDFGVMVFTENSLGASMLAANNSVDVSGIMDYVEFNGSEFIPLVNGGVDVLDYVNEDGSQWPDGPVFHHKYCMIDHAIEDENPILITGSHNWSASAENINDENTLIIFDHSLANQFYQEYTQRRHDQLDLSIETAQYYQIQAFPNPIQDVLNVDSKTSVSYVVQALNGKTVAIGFLEVGTNQIDLSMLETGLYFLSLESGQNLKLIKN